VSPDLGKVAALIVRNLKSPLVMIFPLRNK
jgi:hypothetical protein